MFIWVGKETMTSSLLAESYGPSCICNSGVASVLAELLCIGRVCRSYESNRFCHIDTVLLTLNLIIPHITSKSRWNMLLKNDSGYRFFFIFWFPVKGWHRNSSGVLNGAPRLCVAIFKILFKFLISKVGNCGSQLKITQYIFQTFF